MEIKQDSKHTGRNMLSDSVSKQYIVDIHVCDLIGYESTVCLTQVGNGGGLSVGW